MKQKFLFFSIVLLLMIICNAIFFLIAKFSGLGNNYSFYHYLYLPAIGLILLLILLFFLNPKTASISFAIINLIIIIILSSDYTIESYDLLDIAFFEPSRFCYVVISSIRRLINNETVLINVLMYTIVISGYYYIIFRGAIFLTKRFMSIIL